MADIYTKGDSPSTDDKQVRITRSWKEDREESFTVADLERQMTDCDNQIQHATDRKAELQAKIDEAEKVLAE
jgi:septal ring factor EnvC (AmiA/AmiB activator)